MLKTIIPNYFTICTIICALEGTVAYQSCVVGVFQRDVLLCISPRLCTTSCHSLGSAVVGEFTPRKWAVAAKQGCFVVTVAKHLSECREF